MNTAHALMPASLPMDPLRRATAGYLARFKGESRRHSESDLRAYLRWCADLALSPLAAERAHIELYIRWMQEVRRFKQNTVARRCSVVCCFYRTAALDGIIERSPAENVRRPVGSQESPTLGLSHLQFEAMLHAARESENANDFALVALLGLLGLRIFEALSLDIENISEVHGHRVLTVHGKGDKEALVPMPPAVGRAIDRAILGRESGPILRSRPGNRMNRNAACRRLVAIAKAGHVDTERMHPHMLRHTFVTTMLDAGVDLRDVQIAARHADPRTTMRYDRARKNLDRHPNYVLAAFMSSAT